MPYIPEDDRRRLWRRPLPESPGDLAFLIADAVDDYLLYLKDQGADNYAGLADIDGVLGTAQHEFRRRVLDPYEDLKRNINDEVYTYLEED